MPKTLHLMRHAEARNNIQGDSLRDPNLTERGVEQCKALRESFPFYENVDMVSASPIRRSLQTAIFAMEPLLQHGLKIVALPDAQEATSEPGDTGSDFEKLCDEFQGKVDLSEMTEDWNTNMGPYAPDVKSLTERARRLRVWLRDREEKEIVLIAHGHFNHYMTGDVDDEGNQLRGHWENLEFRSYTFSSMRDDQAFLVETEVSKQRRTVSN